MKPKYCNIYENCNVYENGRINCPFCDNYKSCYGSYNDSLYHYENCNVYENGRINCPFCDNYKSCVLYNDLPENFFQMEEEADLLIL